MNNEKIERDYDKEPIIIKDYNYIFWLLFQLWFIPIIMYILFKNTTKLSSFEFYSAIFIGIPILIAPSLKIYFYAKNKRVIKFLNNEILFLHNNLVIESIKISELVSIKRSYTDYYHKSQDINFIQEIVTIILFPLVILSHLLLILNKYLFIQNINETKEKFRLYSSILIFSESAFINIFPTSSKEYMEIKKYFKDKKNLDIDKQEIVLKYSHYWEKINL